MAKKTKMDLVSSMVTGAMNLGDKMTKIGIKVANAGAKMGPKVPKR